MKIKNSSSVKYSLILCRFSVQTVEWVRTRVYVRVCVCVRAFVYVHVCVRAFVCVCAHENGFQQTYIALTVAITPTDGHKILSWVNYISVWWQLRVSAF